jgi:hypothetical protein
MFEQRISFTCRAKLRIQEFTNTINFQLDTRIY